MHSWVLAACAHAAAATPPACQAGPELAGVSIRVQHDAYVRSEARRLLRDTATLHQLPKRDVCKNRWLYYRGDDNYGLGNVLYDVASAAALAIVLNRTLVYGANPADRKFGTLITWPGMLTMEEADAIRAQRRCGGGALASQWHVVFAPDKCTFHRQWRRERAGHQRCFRRLLGVNWLEERAPLLELSKVHAFTGFQTLLKSAHAQLRARAAALTGGCVATGDRVNMHGALLATLMQPVPAILHAVRWALSHSAPPQQGGGQGRQLAAGAAASSEEAVAPPQIALHVRAMSDYRAKNLTATEQANQMLNALLCVARAAKAVAASRGSRLHQTDAPLSAVVVSSSPELAALLVQRLNNRRRRSATPRENSVVPFVFDWRRYLQDAPQAVAKELAASEDAAASFCARVHKNETHRCNRSAHIRDWGPDPHWVAVVELLLVASVTDVVVGAGYPYFKVCNTFAQIGAALADAAPTWLCSPDAPKGETPRQCATGPRGVRLLCASHAFSTDWGSSMWRSLNATTRYALDHVLDCQAPTCLATPLQPELWSGLKGKECSVGSALSDTPLLFGSQVKALERTHRR